MQQSLAESASAEIRVWLTRRNTSAAQVARRLGYSPSWIHYRLSGKQDLGLNELSDIARELDVTIGDLIGDWIDRESVERDEHRPAA